MFKRILTVCIGNICRSPTAEYIFRHYLGSRDVTVESAGLRALAGKPMDSVAVQLLREHGILADELGHQGRQLTPSMLRHADLILAMERQHVSSISKLAPEVTGKLFLLDKWGQGRDIPDPYRQQRPAFEHVYGLIEGAARSWLRYL